MTIRIAVALLIASVAMPWGVGAKERAGSQLPVPIAWLDLKAGPRDFSVSVGSLKTAARTLPRGALVPVFKTKEKRGAQLAEVAALNFERGVTEVGWVEVS
jgi:hypothetical protein